MSPPEEGSKPSTKSKFVHVPMYQVSYDHQQKGSTSRNTSRHKVRWIFGYASYDALKKKCVGDECRHEEHELEFHLTSTSDGNSKKYRILHNGRILVEEIKSDEEVSSDDNVLFQHDFTIKGKNHDAKLVILLEKKDSSSDNSIKPKLSFGGLPFEDLPQTHEIQRNILSLYVAVPRKEKSKKKATNDYHTLLEEEDEINSRKEEERQQRRKEKKHRSKGENRRASTGNKMMFAHMTQNKEPTLHKLLDGDGTPQPAAATTMTSRAKSETNQRLGFMGDGTRTAIDDDDDEESETAEEPPPSSTNQNEPELDDEALTEQMIEQSLFLAEDQIDHSGEHEQEYWEDGRPKVGRSSSFASISSVGSSCSTVMDGTDSDDDTKNDGSVYLDRSTRSMFDSSTDSSSQGGKQSAARGSQAASSAVADDNDDASISTAGSSVVGKMAELNVDDMLNHLINDSDDSSEDEEDDKKSGGIPASIKI